MATKAVKITTLVSIHERRYLMLKAGKTLADISKLEGVSEDTINRSILMVQGQRELLTPNEMQMQQIGILNELAPLEKESLKAMLTAELEVAVETDGRSETVVVPDHKTREVAHNIVTKRIEAITPKKGGTIQLGVNVDQRGQQKQAEQAASGAQPRSFEDIVRAVNAKKREQLALTSGEGEVETPVLEGGAVIIESESGTATSA